MKAHIVALRIDARNFADGNAQQFAAMRNPQFLEPLAAGFPSFAAPRKRTLDGTFEPFRGDRFQHVIDRLEIEGLDGEIVMGRDEDDRRGIFGVGNGPSHAQSVEFRHRHIEQDQVGREGFHQP